MEYKRKFRQMNDATKAKIRQALKGRSKSFIHAQHISQGLKNYWSQIPNKELNDDDYE